MPLWYIAIFLAAAAGLFYGAMRYWSRARAIEDVPTSRIRSAAQGYVELEGIARADPEVPIAGGLTGKPCVWYEYRIEEYQKRGNKGSWRSLERSRSHHAILLEDTTGQCFLHPDGAQITTAHRDRWRGSTRKPSQLRTTQVWFMGRYRYTESRLHDGDPIYALGVFETLRPATADELTAKHSAELIAEWKQDYDALLRRFDRDGDGNIDFAEWDHVRAAAEREAYASAAQSYDATPVHVMIASPSRSQPYLIANKDPKLLARGYRWKSFGMLCAGLFFAGSIMFFNLASELATEDDNHYGDGSGSMLPGP